MTATAAQIDLITKLQAEWPDVAPGPTRAEWESWAITQGIADERAAAAIDHAATLDDPQASVDLLARMGITETPIVALARRAAAARAEARRERTDEARAARTAAVAELRTAILDDMWALLEARDAARTVDPATLTKAEASRVIDLLK